MKVIVQFSGGKDSLASLIWAINRYGKLNVIPIFMDTGWEHELTYKHIADVQQKLGIVIHHIKGQYSFFSLAKKKKRFPSTKARFCTEYLKVRPFLDWLLKQKESFIIVQGIRAEESAARAKMEKECDYFKYYKQPYGSDKKGKPKYYTYRKKDVLKRSETFATDIVRPFFNHSGSEVMKYILDAGLKPNPLYYMGFKRVGCFPCIMCNKSEMKLLIQGFPERIKEIESMENEVGYTFFAQDYIPTYAHKELHSANRVKKGTKLPTIVAVVSYLKSKIGTMFREEEETKSCMSIYNICE